MAALTFDPLLPVTIWLTLAVAAMALVGAYIRRRPTAVGRRRWAVITSLMFAGIGVVLLLLFVLGELTTSDLGFALSLLKHIHGGEEMGEARLA